MKLAKRILWILEGKKSSDKPPKKDYKGGKYYIEMTEEQKKNKFPFACKSMTMAQQDIDEGICEKDSKSADCKAAQGVVYGKLPYMCDNQIQKLMGLAEENAYAQTYLDQLEAGEL